MSSSNSWAARVGLVLTMVAPPVAAASLWPSFVTSHSLLAILLLIGYETIVTAVRFSSQVAGDLRERWRHRLVDYIDKTLRRRLSRFGSRYRDFVLASQRYIDQKGLETVGFYAPQLDEVFVDVSLAFRAPHQVPSGLLANLPADAPDRRSIKDFLDRVPAEVLAVVGAPGSGKTTLLRHTARQVCLARHGRRRTIPILLYLRDHVATINANFNIGIAELVRRSLRQAGVDEPRDWFEQQLRKGNCVVLLDGLDEVASQQHRTSVADWMERQVARYPKNDYVITSRPHGYRSAPIHGATVLNVLAFTEKQVTEFIHAWYLAVERHATEASGEEFRLRANSAAKDLLDRLNGAPTLYELTVNPLLLTMMVNVHRYRGVLPGSRAKLYREICQVMLGLRQEAKKLPIDLDGDHKEALLRSLAYTMMCRRVVDLPKAEVIDDIRPALRRMSRGRMSRDLTAEDFLADVASNGLLVERENDLYAFAHLTFQEYLAAMYIRGKGLSKVLADRVDDSWWRETTLLYTAQTDADPIVRACLESASVPALALAFDCTEHDSELAPELRDSVDNLLESVFAPDTTPTLRRLMAGVLATRHVRRLIRVGSSNGRICAAPIPLGIYWFFQQDMPGHEPDCAALVAPSVDQPVTGVRGGDALALVRWINNITGSGLTYRLLTRDEVYDPAARRMLKTASSGADHLAVWLAPSKDDERTPLWTAIGARHPHQIDDTTVAQHVKQDLESASSMLARVLLVHSIVANRALHLGLNRTLSLARADMQMRIPEVEVALARARSQAKSINETIGRSLDLDHLLSTALNSNHSVDLASALELARIIRIDLTRTYGPAAILGFSSKIDIDRAYEKATSLTPSDNEVPDIAVDRALALDTVISLDFDQLFDTASASATSFNEGLALDAYLAFDRAIGTALAYAFAQSAYPDGGLEAWRIRFSGIFMHFTGIGTRDEGYLVSPEALADKIEAVWKAVRNMPALANDVWAHQVVANLKEIALPVATREKPITSESASTIRIIALCLAAEADLHEATALDRNLREIVAGITLLERRSTGQSLPTETIVLAIS